MAGLRDAMAPQCGADNPMVALAKQLSVGESGAQLRRLPLGMQPQRKNHRPVVSSHYAILGVT